MTARAALEQELADESVLVARREEVEAGDAQVHEREGDLEAALREDLPALAAGTGDLVRAVRAARAAPRHRSRWPPSGSATPRGSAPATSTTGRDPEALEAEAAQVREQETAIEGEVEEHRVTLEQAVSTRRTAEDAVAEEERRVAGQHRAAADRREGLARLTGQVNSLRSRAAAADDELGRLTQAHEEAVSRAARAQRDFTALETRVAGLDAGEEGLDAEHEAAAGRLDDLEERLAKVREEAQRAERDRAGLAARKDALELGLNRKDGAGALLAASDEVSGLLGSVAALLTVRSGFEVAVAHALGSAADAVALENADSAIAAIGHLKEHDLGRAGLVLGSATSYDVSGWPALPEGASYALDVVTCPETVRPALARLLDRVAVVDDLAAARRCSPATPR